MDQNNIGRGNLLAYILAYGWGSLLFIALIGSIGVGLYWITTVTVNKIRRDKGIEKVKTIAWTVGIVGAILVTALGLTIQVNGK